MKTLYVLGVFLLLIFSIQTVHASPYPDGCTATTKYSSTTGHLCAVQTTCAPGDLFNSQTGQSCSATIYLPGCSSTAGYSITTGSKCDGSNTVTQILNTPTSTQLVTSSQASIKIISVGISGINSPHLASPTEKDDSDYVNLGAIVTDAYGNNESCFNGVANDKTMIITATDTTQNKTIDCANTTSGAGGYFYSYQYFFKTTGVHTITFSADGVSQSITFNVNQMDTN